MVRWCGGAIRHVVQLVTVCLWLVVLPDAGVASVDRRTPVVEAVEKALPSVVNIGTERLVKVSYSDPRRRFRGDLVDKFLSDFFGVPPPPGYRVAHSLGSGVIIDPSGYILTNYHVIERASRIRVTLADESAYDATVLGVDEISDLALIKIRPEKPLSAVELAEDDDLMLGETVIVLGNPFGLAHSVTVGVLSAKNREASYGGEILFRDILQTDAAVNPGSSGGPLLNIEGRLIGINVAIYQEAQNIGFAVPVSRVRDLAAGWFEPKLLRKIWVGLDLADEDSALKIVDVDERSPSGQADLRVGDVIKTVMAQPVSTRYEFNKALLASHVGDAVELGFEREGDLQSATITLRPLPKPSGIRLARQRLGLELGESGAELGRGLVISKVFRGSAAARTGLRPGLWLRRINHFEIQTLDDVGIALEYVRPGDIVSLVVMAVNERGSFLVAQSSTVQVKAD